ncbi:MAG: hypothetical protein WD000_02170 [Thermodesulfobacteriota bacterium]
MNLDALIFMLCAWGFTLGLLAFCIIKLMNSSDHNFNNTEDMDDGE